MSGYKTFAVAGAGNIGRFIIEELLKLKATGLTSSVVVLTRTGSNNDTSKFSKAGAKVVSVDYSSKPSLTAALSGIDVIISTVGGPGLAGQALVADAAKEAGVKLFVPSEFGNPTDNITDGILGQKNALHRKLREIGLPYALFFTGPFSDFVFQPFLGWDLANGKVSIIGDGNQPITFTSRRDIARFVGYALTNLPREKIENRSFRIEGDRQTFNNIASEYQSRTGKSLEVTHESLSEAEENLKKNPSNFGLYLKVEWARGNGTIGKSGELANGDWPEWNPQKVVDILVGA